MSKFFGFLLGVVVALAGPAVFGVLAAEGGIELNAKEMALAYGIGALIFWAVVSFFSGAAALGAFVVFGGMIYAVHWIPNRMTNFLNDVPGVTTGMIDGIKQYTLNGVVPILAAISLVYGIQSIVRSAQRRRRARVEAERTQREQELAQAQQAAEAAQYQPAAAAYPVAGGDYQAPAENRYGSYGNTSYEDLFDDEPEPEPVQPRNQADEQTAMFATSDAADDDKAEEYEEHQPDSSDETRLVPTDGDATVLVPTTSPEPSDGIAAQPEKPAAQEESIAQESVAHGDDPADDETQLTPTSTTAAPAAPAHTPPAAPAYTPPAAPAPSTGTPAAGAPDAGTTAPAAPPTAEQPTVAAPAEPPSAPTPPAPAPAAPTYAAPPAHAEPTAEAPATPTQPSEAAAARPAQPSEAAAEAPATPTQPSEAAAQPAQPTQPSEATAVQPTQPSGSTAAQPSDETVVQPSAPASSAQHSAPAPLASRPPGQSNPDEATPNPAPTEDTRQAAAPPTTPASEVRAEAVQRREEVGQQYRERMDDSTGEHTFGAFENPMHSDDTLPQAPRVMDLPGQFRPAGT